MVKLEVSVTAVDGHRDFQYRRLLISMGSYQRRLGACTALLPRSPIYHDYLSVIYFCHDVHRRTGFTGGLFCQTGSVPDGQPVRLSCQHCGGGNCRGCRRKCAAGAKMGLILAYGRRLPARGRRLRGVQLIRHFCREWHRFFHPCLFSRFCQYRIYNI